MRITIFFRIKMIRNQCNFFVVIWFLMGVSMIIDDAHSLLYFAIKWINCNFAATNRTLQTSIIMHTRRFGDQSVICRIGILFGIWLILFEIWLILFEIGLILLGIWLILLEIGLILPEIGLILHGIWLILPEIWLTIFPEIWVSILFVDLFCLKFDLFCLKFDSFCWKFDSFYPEFD